MAVRTFVAARTVGDRRSGAVVLFFSTLDGRIVDVQVAKHVLTAGQDVLEQRLHRVDSLTVAEHLVEYAALPFATIQLNP